jgi:hypothetical protein
MFQTKVVGKIKTRILYLVVFFFPENCAVYEVIWRKYGGTRETADKKYGGALHVGLVRLHALKHTYAPLHTHTHTHTHAHAHRHMHINM